MFLPLAKELVTAAAKGKICRQAGNLLSRLRSWRHLVIIYQAKYEVTDVRQIYSGCSGGPYSVQACGYNNLLPGRTWLSPLHSCDNIKSPCVAAGLGFTYGTTELGNNQYTTGYFPWAGSSVYTRSINTVTAAVAPQTWEVNCGPISYPWDVSRSFHISNCSNTGYDLLSSWYEGMNVVYKTTTNTMNFRMLSNTSVSSTSNSPIILSPNPAQNQLKISGMVSGQYSIKDVLGKVCDKGTLPANGTINISALQAGIYTVELRNAERAYSTKLSKL
ncbi:MAG: T9SS type A sorting domain-containing protein [Chitinophagaceae bacterium]